ncbi:hypothetical protein FNU79_11575 [Deinococcus detaillensis]|uniref:Uncharacterized protein n=1 Tax=Deinococcus detaillensis TaxID=2592048 RepID=A0A553UUH3_9DEIO|nr:hypothetical protein [Deinococcus detaillensis]TSA83858.1 hypothetical protein FNU79_11575 [Deinococcus detaillensis]
MSDDQIPAPYHRVPEQEVLGIQFTLEDMDEMRFARVLRDITQDPAFAVPLQVRVLEPRSGIDGQVTLAFLPQDREKASAAVQRLKTILLRYGAQVDHIRMPDKEV